MMYRLRTLAFGCAAAALGSALPFAAPHAEETVPGMLRCFENGVETATIGPIFRVWSASQDGAVPAPGPDGCHWQPMTRIAMPGSAPPPQAIVSTEADETAAPGDDGLPRSAAAGLPDGSGAGGTEIMPPVAERSMRMPIDLAVAAELTADAIAVETAVLEPLPDPLDPTVMAGSRHAPAPENRRDPIVMDLALSLDPMTGTDRTPGPHAAAAMAAARAADASPPPGHRNPHPPLSAASARPAPADPFLAAALSTDTAPPAAEPALFPVAAMLAAEDTGAAGQVRLPALLAEALVPSAEAPAIAGPRRVLAEAAAPAARPEGSGAGQPAQGAPRAAVVLASLTPQGHRPNPHPDLPEGWTAATLAGPTQDVAATGDLPRRGDPDMAGAPAEQGATPVTLPGWHLPAPQVPVAVSAAVPPATPAETLMARTEAEDSSAGPDDTADAAGDASAANKIQTANRQGAETATDVEDAPEREHIQVAQAEAVAAPPDAGSVDGAHDGVADPRTIAAVAAVSAPAVETSPADPEDPVAAARGAAPDAVEAAAVPAAATPATAAAASGAASSAGPVPDGWWLQLASLDSPERALWEWNRRMRAANGRLDGHAPTVVRAEIEGRGTFFRLWVGPFDDRTEAGRLCARIEAPQEPCFVHRLDGQIVEMEVAARP